MSSLVDKGANMQRFGEKLHTLRMQRGMTLKELAEALGHTAHGHISELEAGKKLPTVQFVINVARLFNVSTDQLLKDELELDIGQTNTNH
jgi:transcriptional regulator with XRE-family HTH domain